jgi:hypothetical protein
MGRRVSIALMVAMGLTLAAPGSGFAATPLGQAFAPPDGCATDTTYLQTLSPGSTYTAPFNGVITGWSYQADSAPPASVKLKVGRVAPGIDLSMNADITVVGESTPQVPAANTLSHYPAKIPVQAGDFIGIYLGPGGAPNCEDFPDDFHNQFNNSDVMPGTLTPFSNEDGRLDIAALLEPDCNHNGLGDETQETKVSGPGCPPTGQRAAALRKCKKKRKLTHDQKRFKKCRKRAKRLPV